MADIVVYGFRSGSSLRVHWMLAELGLSYQNPALDMRSGAHKQPEYLAINPAGQVPSMVHDGFVMTESAAITRYLADKYDPTLLGKDPEERATGHRWEMFTLLNLDKHFAAHAGKTWGAPADDATIAKANEAIARFLPIIEAWLATHQYLAGDVFTVADLNARCSFEYALTGGVDLSAYPQVVGWMARCAGRAAFIEAKK